MIASPSPLFHLLALAGTRHQHGQESSPTSAIPGRHVTFPGLEPPPGGLMPGGAPNPAQQIHDLIPPNPAQQIHDLIAPSPAERIRDLLPQAGQQGPFLHDLQAILNNYARRQHPADVLGHHPMPPEPADVVHNPTQQRRRPGMSPLARAAAGY